MLKINSYFVDEPMLDIIYTAQSELNIFPDVIDGKNIMVTCPFHKGGMETTPSMGIASEEVEDVETGYVHCFGCGYTGSFSQLIEDVLDAGEGSGDVWLNTRFTPVFVKKKLLPTFEKRERVENYKFLNPSFLDTYDKYHPYLAQRGISKRTAELYMLRYSSYENSILFPVRDVQGRIKFVMERSVDKKKFHFPSGVNKGLYGLYEARLSSDCREILIVESAFNAMSATQWGRPAIALMGTGNDEQMELINQLPYNRLVFAFDPDDAGMKAQNRFINFFRGKKLMTALVIPEGKDVNDLTVTEFLNLPEYNCI